MNAIIGINSNAEDQMFAAGVETDMAAGNKRLVVDLARYSKIREDGLIARSATWRHKESDVVYLVMGVGLAATGNGTLALMVHFFPEKDIPDPDTCGECQGVLQGLKFERQYPLFLEKFEPVVARTVWDKA